MRHEALAARAGTGRFRARSVPDGAESRGERRSLTAPRILCYEGISGVSAGQIHPEMILKTARWQHLEGSNPSPSADATRSVAPSEGEGFGRSPSRRAAPSRLRRVPRPPLVAAGDRTRRTGSGGVPHGAQRRPVFDGSLALRRRDAQRRPNPTSLPESTGNGRFPVRSGSQAVVGLRRGRGRRRGCRRRSSVRRRCRAGCRWPAPRARCRWRRATRCGSCGCR